MTFQAVCGGQTYKDIFAQKQRPHTDSIRNYVPAIPRDLDTIIQKAIEFEPDKRYQSAKELSNDLERFLEDRPIHARRVTAVEQLWRWCRRNRALAGMAATTACLFALLPIVMGWAYMQKAAQSQQIENTLTAALTGFDEIFRPYVEDESATAIALSDSSSEEVQNLAPAMLTQDTARILEGILKFYDRLAETNSSTNNLDLSAESARARRRVGDIYQRLGQFEKSISAYQDARTRYSDLATQEPAYLFEIARIHQSLGSIYAQQQQHQRAREQYEFAFKLLKSKGFGESRDYELARTRYLLGKRVGIEGMEPGGPNGPGGPGDRGPRHRGPRSYGGKEVPPYEKSPASEKERMTHLREAVSLLDSLHARESSAKPAYRFLLAMCLRELSTESTGAEVDSPRTEAVQILEQLIDDHPDVPRYRFELSETYRAHHTSRFGASDFASYEDQLHKARELSEGLVNEHREIASYRIHLAHIYAHLSIEYGRAGNLRRAEEFTRKAYETHDAVVANFPGLAALSTRLSNNDKVRLGEWFVRLHRWEEVIELLQPLGERLDDTLRNDTLTPIEKSDAQTTLQRCGGLLLPAYEFVGDDVGYVVANTWQSIDDSDTEPLDDFGDDERPGYGRGPGGPPGRRGPPGRHRGPGLFLGPLIFELNSKFRATELVDLAMSYDVNDDHRLTRDEFPSKMAQEWFNRMDGNRDGSVFPNELMRVFRH